jgi:lipid II:glycine glycyltransferase (peptidoglycan interpeptide bridge formation enzyme)
MRRQTRYEVRRAGKLGITVGRGDSEELFREFHEIQLETAKRQGFVPPSLKVLLAEREAFLGRIWIYVARTGTPEERKEETSSSKVACSKAPDKRKGETNDSKTACGKTPDKKGGEAIAYGLIIHDGNEGDYYEAASTDLNRKLPGAYGLLWQVIRDLKKEGIQRFNLWGIAPAGQPGHRYAGVTTFKTGFGGEVTEFVPAHDLVISKIGYLKNLIVEKARKKWRHL